MATRGILVPPALRCPKSENNNTPEAITIREKPSVKRCSTHTMKIQSESLASVLHRNGYNEKKTNPVIELSNDNYLYVSFET